MPTPVSKQQLYNPFTVIETDYSQARDAGKLAASGRRTSGRPTSETGLDDRAEDHDPLDQSRTWMGNE